MYVITDEVFRRMISLANSEVFHLLQHETKYIDIKDFDELKKKLDDSGYEAGVKDGAKYGYQ